MTGNQYISYLARRVLAQINESYPESSANTVQTAKSLSDAIASLSPFEPDESDIAHINNYLINRNASDIACKAAWALYKDIVVNESKN